MRFVQEGDANENLQDLIYDSHLRRGWNIRQCAGDLQQHSIAVAPPRFQAKGPEAYAFSEIGDGLIFTPGSNRLVTKVTVILDDWACVSGHWYNPAGTADSCVTNPAGATFSQPVTLHIYAVNSSTTPISAGALLASQTSTFTIPYRPTSDAVCATAPLGSDGTKWYDATTNACYHGITVPIVSTSPA